jgi:cell division protein FtsL
MPMQHPSHEFEADDQKVFNDWLRKTVVAYIALVLCCVAVVTVQAMTRHVTNVAMVVGR